MGCEGWRGGGGGGVTPYDLGKVCLSELRHTWVLRSAVQKTYHDFLETILNI